MMSAAVIAPRRITPLVWIDVAVLSALTVIGLLGFASAFEDYTFMLAGAGGLVVGTTVAIVGARLHWGLLVTTLAGVAAYFLCGSVLAMPGQALLGFIPNVETLSGLAVGAVFGWADIVTLSAPVAAPDYINVLPYVACWLVGFVSGSLVSRWYVVRPRNALRSLVAVAGPVAIYFTSVITGTQEPYLAAFRGISFAAVAIVWLSWRRPSVPGLGERGARLLVRRRILGVGAVALVGVVLASTLGFVLAPTPESRFVLRQEVDPPFDPLLYPSPLSGFRKYTKDLTDTVLFSVTGLDKGQRIRLATMDSYDGNLWNVTGPDIYREGSGSFTLVGRSARPTVFVTPGENTSVAVSVGDYQDFWLPAVGYPEQFTFGGDGIKSTALRYNQATGIAVVVGGVSKGLRYEVDSETQLVPSDADLAAVPVAPVQLPPVSDVPDIVAAKATELAGAATTPIARLRAIESALSTQGFLSHGSGSEQVASSAGHGAYRMKLLLERSQWIGDAEQYASVFALMARSLGYPARVVMGFAPESGGAGQVDVTGDDVDAWVEIAFDGVGWIPFYPTPDETEIPQDQTPKPKSEPQPQVRQPPRSDTEQDDLVAAVDIEKADKEKKPEFQIPGWVWTVAASIAVPLVIYFVPLLLIAFIKRRRRRRRMRLGTTSARAGGAWDELVDVYAELGYSVSRTGTRLQVGLSFEQQLRDETAARETDPVPRTPSAEVTAGIEATVMRNTGTSDWRPGVDDPSAPHPVLDGLREFAVGADAAVFSGAPAPQESVDALWIESTRSAKAARQSVSGFRRWLSRFRLHSRASLAQNLATRLSASARPSIRGAQSR